MKRKIGLILVFGAALPLVAVSAAWACGVLATVTLDTKVAAPGQTVTATGKNYSSAADAPVTIRLKSRSGQVLATTNAECVEPGSTRPSPCRPTLSPGWYVVLATQTLANGTPKSGTPGRTTLRVQGTQSSRGRSRRMGRDAVRPGRRRWPARRAADRARGVALADHARVRLDAGGAREALGHRTAVRRLAAHVDIRRVTRAPRALSAAVIAGVLGPLALIPAADAAVRVGQNYRMTSDSNAFRGKDQLGARRQPGQPAARRRDARELPHRALRGDRELRRRRHVVRGRRRSSRRCRRSASRS